MTTKEKKKEKAEKLCLALQAAHSWSPAEFNQQHVDSNLFRVWAQKTSCSLIELQWTVMSENQVSWLENTAVVCQGMCIWKNIKIVVFISKLFSNWWISKFGDWHFHTFAAYLTLLSNIKGFVFWIFFWHFLNVFQGFTLTYLISRHWHLV